MHITLFGNDYQVIKRLFREKRGQEVSESFLQAADARLSLQFRQETGLETGTWISLAISDLPAHNYAAEEQVMDLHLFVNGHLNPVRIHWESLDGSNCRPEEPLTDPDSFRCWFSQLDTALYVQQLYPGEKLPFRFNYLNYPLTVTQTVLDAVLVIAFHPGTAAPAARLMEGLNQLLQRLNGELLSGSTQLLREAGATVLSSTEQELAIRLQPGDTGWRLLHDYLLLLSNKKEVAGVLIR